MTIHSLLEIVVKLMAEVRDLIDAGELTQAEDLLSSLLPIPGLVNQYTCFAEVHNALLCGNIYFARDLANVFSGLPLEKAKNFNESFPHVRSSLVTGLEEYLTTYPLTLNRVERWGYVAEELKIDIAKS